MKLDNAELAPCSAVGFVVAVVMYSHTQGTLMTHVHSDFNNNDLFFQKLCEEFITF